MLRPASVLPLEVTQRLRIQTKSFYSGELNEMDIPLPMSNRSAGSMRRAYVSPCRI